jgi:pimeloyl-ACP methyl ester carboxylesterase
MPSKNKYSRVVPDALAQREKDLMTSLRWLLPLLVVAVALGTARAGPRHRPVPALHGQLLDFTNNNGADRRIYSPALHEYRDLYVYLPPGFDPEQEYPIILLLHGFTEDEGSFLQHVQILDEAMACGDLPAAIMAAPDGSIKGRPSIHHSHSLFANTQVGDFEDFLMIDVWNFLVENFPIRPEPEAHVLVGVSMGGCAAFRLAIDHRDQFKVVLGIFPALNLRWVDCHGRYWSKFDPCCWGWRTKSRPHEVVGRFYGGLVKVRSRMLMDSLIPKRGPAAIAELSRLNPIERIDATCLQEGELAMFVAYAGRDEFNLDAQAESFIYLARERGLTVTAVYDPDAKHNFASGLKMFPDAIRWVAPLLAPFSPP